MADDFERLVLGSAGTGGSDVPLFLQDDAGPQKPNSGSSSNGGGGGGGGGGAASPSFVDSTIDAPSAAGEPPRGGSAVTVSSAETLFFPSPASRRLYCLKREKILGRGTFGCATLYRHCFDYLDECAAGRPEAEVRGYRAAVAAAATTAAAAARVVVKDVNLQAMANERAEEVAALRSEVEALAAVRRHPGCLQLLDCFSSSAAVDAAAAAAAAAGKDSVDGLTLFSQSLLDRDTKMAYIVTEFCEGGDLADVLEGRRRPGEGRAARDTTASGGGSSEASAACVNLCNRRFFSEAYVASVAIQLLTALHHLHTDKKIIHRDVKPQNIFFRADGLSMRLGDFGIAFREGATVDLSSSQLRQPKGTAGAYVPASAGSKRKDVRGTPFYMAPELFEEKSRYDYAVDIYSAGVVLYELIAREKPFISTNVSQLAQMTLAGTYTKLRDREDLKKPTSKKAAAVAAEAVEENIFSKDLLELVTSMLTVDPQRRPSAHRLLKKSYIRRQLHVVPRELLASAAYRSTFGDEAVNDVLARGACVFAGLADDTAALEEAMHLDCPSTTGVMDAAADAEYADDDFDSTDSDTA